jgi:hypothetical protein
MSKNTPRTKEELLEDVAAYEEHGTYRKAAEAIGVACSTFSDRMKRAGELGLLGTDPVIHGFRISRVSTQEDETGHTVKRYIQQKPELGDKFEQPEGHSVKGVSALVDADGRVIQKWIKTRNEYSAEQITDMLKAAYEAGEFDFVRPVTPRYNVEAWDKFEDDKLTLYPLADFHLGLFSWGKETGLNWDLKIAEEKIGETLEEVFKRSPRSREGIVLGGGDLLHSDTNENKTAKSGNALQVDGRYQKILFAACRLMVKATELALHKHEKVTVRILQGNHDEHSSFAVAYFLLAWFRNEPRVTIDCSPSIYFWYEFGKVLIGAAHGHTVKMNLMPQIMASIMSEAWGRTLHRYVHGFHIHHKSQYVSEGGGVICESHQTPTAKDAWHAFAGYLSGRSIQSITYHALYGEISRVRVALLDA